ncbi:hypothetical protein [Solimonas variicoloris]|uniref:hypothetical protein n=1 Tax=Solimonas variicoloris TaxID=254408 RepID=UPI00146BB254|nr:hypothetical protein [Solimonas variicoloris]
MRANAWAFALAQIEGGGGTDDQPGNVPLSPRAGVIGLLCPSRASLPRAFSRLGLFPFDHSFYFSTYGGAEPPLPFLTD